MSVSTKKHSLNAQPYCCVYTMFVAHGLDTYTRLAHLLSEAGPLIPQRLCTAPWPVTAADFCQCPLQGGAARPCLVLISLSGTNRIAVHGLLTVALIPMHVFSLLWHQTHATSRTKDLHFTNGQVPVSIEPFRLGLSSSPKPDRGVSVCVYSHVGAARRRSCTTLHTNMQAGATSNWVTCVWM